MPCPLSYLTIDFFWNVWATGNTATWSWTGPSRNGNFQIQIKLEFKVAIEVDFDFVSCRITPRPHQLIVVTYLIYYYTFVAYNLSTKYRRLLGLPADQPATPPLFASFFRTLISSPFLFPPLCYTEYRANGPAGQRTDNPQRGPRNQCNPPFSPSLFLSFPCHFFPRDSKIK